ncbi:unnamed protein product [Toxocara canis]|uniref:DB domain-containing protein n=1 Tax=Toxocara canis TaxID=6265 RepID=A0A183UA78_TOXCA|nr:unnamed protein product [Toxocara canis]
MVNFRLMSHHLALGLTILLYVCITTPVVDARRDSNQKFKACCARQKDADKACKRKFCDFNAIRQDNVIRVTDRQMQLRHLTICNYGSFISTGSLKDYCFIYRKIRFQMLFFLSTCSAKGATVKRMWDCASSRIDHTECCKNNNVQPECVIFCNTTTTVPEDYYSHLHCLQSFAGIRDCFRWYLEKNANIFGDN